MGLLGDCRRSPGVPLADHTRATVAEVGHRAAPVFPIPGELVAVRDRMGPMALYGSVYDHLHHLAH